MTEIRDYCVSDGQTIKDAINAIQGNLSRCVVVLNDNKKVIGIISEGDVLRALLNDIEIHTPLKKIVNPSFQYLQERNMFKAYNLVKKYGITLIPIIDEDFYLKNVITIFDVMNHLDFVNGKE